MHTKFSGKSCIIHVADSICLVLSAWQISHRVARICKVLVPTCLKKALLYNNKSDFEKSLLERPNTDQH